MDTTDRQTVFEKYDFWIRKTTKRKDSLNFPFLDPRNRYFPTHYSVYSSVKESKIERFMN